MATILLVDDCEADILLTKVNLIKKGKLGCNLIVARDGHEALDFIRTNPDIKIILLDVNMPKINGFELLRQMLREDLSLQNIPVIACSGSQSDYAKNILAQLGAVEYLDKPINIEKLEEVIGNIAELSC